MPSSVNSERRKACAPHAHNFSYGMLLSAPCEQHFTECKGDMTPPRLARGLQQVKECAWF